MRSCGLVVAMLVGLLAAAWGAPTIVGPEVKIVDPGVQIVRPDAIVGPDAEPISHRSPSSSGNESPPGAAPDDASYRDVVAVGTDRGYTCSGVLIAARLVITARHCGAVTQIAVGSRLGVHARDVRVVDASVVNVASARGGALPVD